MAIVSIHEKIGSTESTVEYGTMGRVATYRRVFAVETDDATTHGPYGVMEAVSLYANVVAGSWYVNAGGTEEDKSALFQRARAVPDPSSEDGCEWIVTLDYGPVPNVPETPLQEAPLLSIDGREIEVPVTTDVAGNLIVNSAGDPFDPPITRSEDRIILTVSRNEASQAYADQYFLDTGLVYPGWVFNFDTIKQIANKVNVAPFLGYGPHKVKGLRPRVVRNHHPMVGWYWSVTYYFEIKDEDFVIGEGEGAETVGSGWDRVVLDAGYRTKDGSELNMITIDGQPIQEPALLDGEGQRLDAGEDPVYMAFALNEEMDFNMLGLPV